MIDFKLEEGIIKHASSTLAGIKCGSLFSYFFKDKNEVINEVALINLELNASDVYIEILRFREESALIYVYRKELLRKQLNNIGNRKLLQTLGYSPELVEKSIIHLKENIDKHDDFPHEIGVFLNYPIEDVIGFIRNKGSNCKFIGMWKVYGNIEESESMFRKYNYCSRIYAKLFSEGRTLESMTVKKRIYYVSA